MTVGVYNKTILKAKEVEQWTARSLALSSRRKAKGLTQKQLADRLSITDKAVSKWERGLGFPDIKLLEPLSQALDVSILGLMRSQHIEKSDVAAESVSEALSTVLDIASFQRKNVLIATLSTAAVIMAIFLIDSLQLMGFFMVCLPVVLVAMGVILLVVSWKRHRQKLTYSFTLLLAVLALVFPIILFLFLAFAFVLGGPIPQ